MDYAIVEKLVRFRRGTLRVSVAAVLAWSPMLVFGGAALPASDAMAETTPRVVSRQHTQIRRNNAAERRRENNLKSFTTDEGTPTLTNRGSKYSNKDKYEEVKIDFQPIYIDPKWRKKKRPKSVQNTALTTMTYGSEELRSIITEQSKRYNVDEELISAVIKVESNWNPNAVSTSGACGLMQLMPGTAGDMGVSDIFDPYENIAGGTQYLSKMLEMFNDDTTLALAAYNAGPGNVLKYGGIPPFEETQDYVVKVQNLVGTDVVLASLAPVQQPSVFSKKSVAAAPGKVAAPAPAAPAPRERVRPGQPLQGAHLFLVHFHSGLSQPADEVVDVDPYYEIKYGRRSFQVRKDLVKEVVKRAS